MSIHIINGQPWEQSEFNDLQTDSITGWSTAPAFPKSIRSSQVCVTNNKVFIVGIRSNTDGGTILSTYSANIDINGVISSWSIAGSLVTSLSGGAIVLLQNKLYHIGGEDTSGISSTIIQQAIVNEDGTLGPWNFYGNLPIASEGHEVVVTVDKIYLIGLNRLSAPIDSTGNIGTWTNEGAMPTELYSPGDWTPISLFGYSLTPSIIKTSSKVYVVSGLSIYSAAIEMDGTLGEFIAESPISGLSSGAELFGSAVMVTKNRVFLIGGRNTELASSKRVRTAPIIDGNIGSWSYGEDLPAVCFAAAAFSTVSKVYVVSTNSSYIYVADFIGGLNDYLNSTWYESSFWTNFKGQTEIS